MSKKKLAIIFENLKHVEKIYVHLIPNECAKLLDLFPLLEANIVNIYRR